MKRKTAITCAVAGNVPFNRNHSYFPVTPEEICAAAVEAAEAGCEKTPLLNRPAPAQFALQIESFCDSIRLDTAPSVTGEEGLVALCVLRGIYESFETGRLMPIDGQLATGAHA